ncbi:hypothetical protein, partial [Nostoc sp. DedQUE07]|uniref:hypothetical protein n=1 Tax=Nostoc sp. DedQUE07 TaxID=3075392 RepID=UPI00391A5EEA
IFPYTQHPTPNTLPRRAFSFTSVPFHSKPNTNSQLASFEPKTLEQPPTTGRKRRKKLAISKPTPHTPNL